METRRDTVNVFPPQYCDANSPQLYCSEFETLSHATCQARLGSAVICDESSISGVVVNEGACNPVGDSNLLSYHSIGDYQEWIREVSGAEVKSNLETI